MANFHRIFALSALLVACAQLGALTTDEEARGILAPKEAELNAVITEIRHLYRDDCPFLAAFDTANVAWERYCEALLDARFPGEPKHQVWGTVHTLAYASVKADLIAKHLQELELWLKGIEEGDVSAGSVKRPEELQSLRKKE